MRAIVLLAIAWPWAAGPCLAQTQAGQVDPSRVPAPAPHFESEFLFDAPGDAEAWAREPGGLRAVFGSTDRIYARRNAPGLDAGRTSWTATGWRGERLNALVLVWSRDGKEQVRLDAADLANEAGQVLARDAIRLRMVRYVLSNFPAGARNTDCDAGPTDAAWLMPDRLEPLDRFDLPARSVRPVWVTIDIPSSAASGPYTGTVSVRSGDEATEVRLTVRVQAALLPPPSEWRFRLDLWQNPWVIAWHYGLQPWSDEHRALMKQHLRLYADAGGKYITTYAVHSPWQDNSYMVEGGMIEWTRQTDGRWRFDYRIFDEYVALAMDAGVTGAITIYTPLPWGNRFRYLDERTGRFEWATWAPASHEFRTAWRAFLDDLRRHLERQGWLSRTYLGINENPLEQTRAAIEVIKEHWAGWRITYAGDWHLELSGLIDDYSSVAGKEPQPDELRARATKGMTSTFYVCCTPPVPNTFVFSPPVEARWLGWYAAARGYDGFLRWAYDAWPADPVRDARHVLWPAGDTFLVYPGAASSIRFEKLREGIVDFEKIRLLRARIATAGGDEATRLLEQLDGQLSAIAAERIFESADMERRLERAGEVLAALSDHVPR